MSDAHRHFPEWLAAGAIGEPPRDAALHASVCPECLGQVAALDELLSIDVGHALLPASRVMLAERPHSRAARVARVGAARAGLMLVAAMLGVGASRILGGRAATAPTPMPAPGVPGGAVLDATGTPAAANSTPTASSSATAATTVAPLTASPTASPRAPILATEAPATPRPRPTATARPATPAPSPSASPTSAPTATATPTPEPSHSATVAPSPSPTPTSSPTPTGTSSPSPAVAG